MALMADSMSDKFENPLVKFKSEIALLSDEFPDYMITNLRRHGIHLNETKVELGKQASWIDWDKYRDHFSFYFDFENNEEKLREYFKNSDLGKCSYVIMEFGYQYSVCQIPLEIFIKYWYELVIIAGYESVVYTPDGSLFMEFIKKRYYLKSNFLIDPSSKPKLERD